MKFSKKLLTLAASTFLALNFTGCDLFGSDDTSEVSISFESDNATTVQAGQNIAVDGTIDATPDIKSVTYEITSSVTNADLTQVTYSATSVTGKEGDVDLTDDVGLKIMATASACDGDYSLKVTVTLSDDASATKSFAFKVAGGTGCMGTPLGTAVTDTIFNLDGPAQGAYDLKTGSRISSSGDEGVKDLKDLGIDLNAASADNWSAKLESGNGGMFVKVTSVDFDTATKEGIAAAYTAGTAAATTDALAADDLYIIKLRGAEEYALIKIVSVYVDATANGDYIEFSYKM